MNFFYVLLSGIAFGLYARDVAVYAGVALIRWFARAHAYALGAPLRTTASDITYAVTLLAGIMLAALLSLTSGAILDTVTRGRWEVKRLQYLALKGPGVE